MLTQNYWTNKVDYKINGSEILKDYDLIKIEIPKNKNKLEADYGKIWNLLKKTLMYWLIINQYFIYIY